MSSSLYQTFYMNNKFDDPSTINNLTQWMIFRRAHSGPAITDTPECIHRTGVVDIPILQYDKNDQMDTPDMKSSSPILPCDDNPSPDNSRTHPIVPNSGVPLKPNHHLYIPNRPNTLFWSLYVAYYGEAAYLAIGNKYGNVEIAEKQKIMEFLKPNKKLLKTMNKKITIGTTQEIMSDLMTNMKTSLLSVIAFAAYYKRNILLLNTNNKTCLEHVYSTDITTPWIVIQYTDSKKYGVLLGDDIFDISSFISGQYIYIETYDKPLKGISTYKMNELVEIASKIPEMPKSDNPKTIKSELYGKIWHYCLWI